VGFLALFFVWPTVALIGRGVSEAGSSTMPWSRIADAAVTTVWLAGAGTVLTLAVGLPAAWALFRTPWRGSRVAIALVTVPFVLPTIVVASAWRALVRDVDAAQTESGIALTIMAALVFFNIAVVVRIVGPAFASLDDRAYFAARTLGASPWRATWHVRLPSLAPALAAAAATVWLFCSASFGVVIVIGSGSVSTIDTEIWLQANYFLNLSAAALLSILQIVVIASTLFVVSRLRAKRHGVWRGRAVASQRSATSWRHRAGIAACLLPAVVVLTAPTVALIRRSLTVDGAFGLDHYARVFSGELIAGTGSSALSAAGRSLLVALVVGVVATVLALAAAVVIARRTRGALLHGVLLLPLGVSSVVVGLGALLTLARPLPGGFSLVDAQLLMPVAHIVIALPLAASVIVPAMRAIDPALLASAASLGASPWRVWTRVEWPLVRRATAMAAGIAAAVSLGEFGASSFLARPGTETLPVLIFRLLGRPGPDNLGLAFAIAVVLAVLTAGLMLAADNRRLEAVVAP
jgi:thiamine transport system permease protein